ncbi:unnamed protein product [Caenorhabditis sp. 36 PRJEB53466]|nr:unnamed protein product [Caenorhabditis sp. 36 PRJEB53466]
MNRILLAAILLVTAVLGYNDRSCGFNEQYSPCTQLCPPTCENPNPTCRVDCNRPSCNCIPGHVYSNGRCIPANSCFQSGRCRTSLDCRYGTTCINGVCGASGSYSRTIVTSSQHQHSHSIHNGCTLDIHCGSGKICINAVCVRAPNRSNW